MCVGANYGLKHLLYNSILFVTVALFCTPPTRNGVQKGHNRALPDSSDVRIRAVQARAETTLYTLNPATHR